jgi:hypothetical protein
VVLLCDVTFVWFYVRELCYSVCKGSFGPLFDFRFAALAGLVIKPKNMLPLPLTAWLVKVASVS